MEEERINPEDSSSGGGEPSSQPEPVTPSGGPGSSNETSTNMDPKLAALLAYLFGWVSGLIFYLIETKNKFVRFHALQSILLSVAAAVVFIAEGIIFGILGAIPGLGLLFISVGALASSVLGLGFLVLWVVLMVRAYQGEMWKLPVIGDIAEKNS